MDFNNPKPRLTIKELNELQTRIRTDIESRIKNI